MLQIQSARTVRSFSTSPVLRVVLGSSQEDLHLLHSDGQVFDTLWNDDELPGVQGQIAIAQTDEQGSLDDEE